VGVRVVWCRRWSCCTRGCFIEGLLHRCSRRGCCTEGRAAGEDTYKVLEAGSDLGTQGCVWVECAVLPQALATRFTVLVTINRLRVVPFCHRQLRHVISTRQLDCCIEAIVRSASVWICQGCDDNAGQLYYR
jgi:hypothetical protein